MLEVTSREGGQRLTPTSVDYYLGICGFHHRCADVLVISEEACSSRLSPQAQQDQSTKSLLRTGDLECVQYLVALTVSVRASSRAQTDSASKCGIFFLSPLLVLAIENGHF